MSFPARVWIGPNGCPRRRRPADSIRATSVSSTIPKTSRWPVATSPSCEKPLRSVVPASSAITTRNTPAAGRDLQQISGSGHSLHSLQPVDRRPECHEQLLHDRRRLGVPQLCGRMDAGPPSPSRMTGRRASSTNGTRRLRLRSGHDSVACDNASRLRARLVLNSGIVRFAQVLASRCARIVTNDSASAARRQSFLDAEAQREAEAAA